MSEPRAAPLRTRCCAKVRLARIATGAALTLLAGPAAAEMVDVPSGQTVTFVEVIRDAPGAEGLAYRFRFLAPEIASEGPGISFSEAIADMEHLCSAYAVPRISNVGPAPAQIIISLSDRAVAFGEPAPEATQFFEAYRVQDGRCIWEEF